MFGTPLRAPDGVSLVWALISATGKDWFYIALATGLQPFGQRAQEHQVYRVKALYLTCEPQKPFQRFNTTICRARIFSMASQQSEVPPE